MSDEIARIHELMTQLASQKAGLQNAMDMAEKRERELKQRIEALEAQEMGFIQSLCSQSEDIWRLKQRNAALEEAALKVVETSGRVDHSGIYAYEMDYRRAIQRLAALLPGGE